MSIANLIRRLVVNRPLTAADHDANLDAIEIAVDGKESTGTAAAAVAAAAGSYATAAQGATADTAVQPATLSTYLTSAAAATTYQPLTANLTTLGANGAAYYLARANHTGTQAANTITGLATVATSGSYADLSGRPTAFDPFSPGAIGGTLAAPGTFTALSASTSLLLPNTAGTAAGHVYRSGNLIHYRDSSNVEKILLNSADSLANLNSPAQAFINLLFGNAGSPSIYSLATIITNGGAGISSDLTAGTSGGTTPSHGTGPSTGTTTTGASGVYLNPGLTYWFANRGRQSIQSYRYLSLSALIRIPTLSDDTDTFTIFVGGYSDLNVYSSRSFAGAQIVGSTITATNINAGTVTSSSATATIAANTWAKIQVVYNGTTLSVIINNGTPLTVASGFSTSADTSPLAWGVTIAKTAGTGNRNVNVANTPIFVGWTALP